MVSVTSASSYVTSASRYQSRYSMFMCIRGLISRSSTELAEAVPIGSIAKSYLDYLKNKNCFLNGIVFIFLSHQLIIIIGAYNTLGAFWSASHRQIKRQVE